MYFKQIFVVIFSIIFIYSCSSSSNQENSTASTSTATSMIKPDAPKLFQTNCASCHNPLKDGIGPALNGTLSRVPSREWLVKWIRNSKELIESGDSYAVAVHEKWNKSPMLAFPNLTDEEIQAIIDEYCQ